MNNYQRAIRYAGKIGKLSAVYSPLDIVHDTIINFHKNHNKNILKEDIEVILYWVKSQYNNYISSQYTTGGRGGPSKFIIPKERFKKINKSINDDEKPYNIYDNNNPEEILINGEYVEKIYQNISKFDKEVLHLKLEGYQNQEIEKILDKSNPIITKSIKNIKEKMHTFSPFSGSKLKIIKRISRKTFEKDKEKYMEAYGKEGDWDINEYYEQFPSKTNPNEGLLVREGENGRDL